MVGEQHTEIALRAAVQDGNVLWKSTGVVSDTTFTIGCVAAEETFLCWVLGCGHAHLCPGRLLWKNLDKELLYCVYLQ